MLVFGKQVVILLVTEIAPKSIAVHNATEVARFVVRPRSAVSGYMIVGVEAIAVILETVGLIDDVS